MTLGCNVFERGICRLRGADPDEAVVFPAIELTEVADVMSYGRVCADATCTEEDILKNQRVSIKGSKRYLIAVNSAPVSRKE